MSYLNHCPKFRVHFKPMWARQAVHEAQVAVEVIVDELPGNKALAENRKSSAFNARAIPSVAYTDTEVA